MHFWPCTISCNKTFAISTIVNIHISHHYKDSSTSPAMEESATEICPSYRKKKSFCISVTMPALWIRKCIICKFLHCMVWNGFSVFILDHLSWHSTVQMATPGQLNSMYFIPKGAIWSLAYKSNQIYQLKHLDASLSTNLNMTKSQQSLRQLLVWPGYFFNKYI